MAAREVVRLLDLLQSADVAVWLDGGWGVDALLGEETREHDDLDLVVELSDVPQLTEALVGAGYEQVAGEAPKSLSSSIRKDARSMCIRLSSTAIAVAASTRWTTGESGSIPVPASTDAAK
ncbi:MAG TPA: hypothetical protein VF101_01370, partial [Gaiellaceae bacterium]